MRYELCLSLPADHPLIKRVQTDEGRETVLRVHGDVRYLDTAPDDDPDPDPPMMRNQEAIDKL